MADKYDNAHNAKYERITTLAKILDPGVINAFEETSDIGVLDAFFKELDSSGVLNELGQTLDPILNEFEKILDPSVFNVAKETFSSCSTVEEVYKLCSENEEARVVLEDVFENVRELKNEQ